MNVREGSVNNNVSGWLCPAKNNNALEFAASISSHLFSHVFCHGTHSFPPVAAAGARVVMLCRDLQKAKAAAEEIHHETGNPVAVHHLDLASLQSIRNAAEILNDTEPNIHILINNAGTNNAHKQWLAENAVSAYICS